MNPMDVLICGREDTVAERGKRTENYSLMRVLGQPAQSVCTARSSRDALQREGEREQCEEGYGHTKK